MVGGGGATWGVGVVGVVGMVGGMGVDRSMIGGPHGGEDGGVVDLGVFTAGQLRAGGINARGVVQPLMPIPPGMDPGAESRSAAEGLARRGLLVNTGSGWRPVGRLARLLTAAAAARSLVVWERGPADVGGSARACRLMMGALGDTDRVLDLAPEGEGYRGRLLGVADAVTALVDHLGSGTGAGPGRPGPGPGRGPSGPGQGSSGPGRGVAGPGSSGPVVAAGSPGWPEVDALLERSEILHRVEAASMLSLEEPPVQQRLLIYGTGAGSSAWLSLGTRRGEACDLRAAPVAASRLAALAEALVMGQPAPL